MSTGVARTDSTEEVDRSHLCVGSAAAHVEDVWGVNLAADTTYMKRVVARLDKIYLDGAGGGAAPPIQLVTHDRSNIVKHALSIACGGLVAARIGLT